MHRYHVEIIASGTIPADVAAYGTVTLTQTFSDAACHFRRIVDAISDLDPAAVVTSLDGVATVDTHDHGSFRVILVDCRDDCGADEDDLL
jgi:hypothetical protein